MPRLSALTKLISRQEHLIDDGNNAIVGLYVRLHNMCGIDPPTVTAIDKNLLSLDSRGLQPLTSDFAGWYLTG
jgi:hypothetical protein